MHSSGSAWVSFLLGIIRTVTQQTGWPDAQCHQLHPEVARQGAWQTIWMGSHQWVRARRRGLWWHLPHSTPTALQNFRGHTGWEAACCPESCHYDTWMAVSHVSPKNNEMARIKWPGILSPRFAHWQLDFFYSALYWTQPPLTGGGSCFEDHEKEQVNYQWQAIFHKRQWVTHALLA